MTNNTWHGSQRGLRNPHRDDPSKRPPAGWKARNFIYQQILARAQRVNVPALSAQLSAFESVRREDQIVVLMFIEKALHSLADPETMNLRRMLEDYRKQHPLAPLTRLI